MPNFLYDLSSRNRPQREACTRHNMYRIVQCVRITPPLQKNKKINKPYHAPPASCDIIRQALDPKLLILALSIRSIITGCA